MSRYIFALVGIALSTFAVGAQENRLPLEAAQAYAKVCAQAARQLGAGPLKMDVDPDKPCAARGEGGGAMVVPDRKLTEETLKKAGKEIVPVGQLWLRKWTLVKNGKPLGKDAVNTVLVNVDDKDRPMPLLRLGVRKNAKGKLELLVLANDTEPVLSVPLTEYGYTATVPAEIDWMRGDKHDTLTVNLVGKYQAIVPITRQGN